MKNGIQVKVLGDLEFMPEDAAQSLRNTEEITKDNHEARLNVCVCYNSKYEILDAFNNISEMYAKGQL